MSVLSTRLRHETNPWIEAERFRQQVDQKIRRGKSTESISLYGVTLYPHEQRSWKKLLRGAFRAMDAADADTAHLGVPASDSTRRGAGDAAMARYLLKHGVWRRAPRVTARACRITCRVTRIARGRSRRSRVVRTVTKKAASSSSGDGDPSEPSDPAAWLRADVGQLLATNPMGGGL